MDYNKIKQFGYIIFGLFMALLVFISFLGIWGVVSESFGVRAMVSIVVIGVAFLLFIVVGQKLFGDK